MGVSGLLPLLKSIQKPTELKKYSGQTLGVDAYGWLHRAAYSCALELGQGKPTKKFIHAALHRVRMLRHFGVTPYLVFDGDYLPSKAATEDAREKSRGEKKKLALELLRSGKTAQATQAFQKCIDVTPEMASALIQQLKKLDVPYVVAPYEADAQLVYLEKHGFIDGILSDDSDLLVFGAKKLLTKLDGYGNCIEINRRDFCACREISLTGWSDAEFRRMAIMSGCDYLEGLPGVGLKTAYRMIRKTKSPERVVRLLQLEGKRIDENYLTYFYQAELTFLHQWVFCPTKKQLVHLTDLDGSRTAEEMPYIGSYVETEIAQRIAAGDVHPMTKAPINLPVTPSKRRHSETAPTPAASARPLKPINSYFKGSSRIPMGNMDPNCFSVDPDRLSLITNGGSAPRVFPLPRPYIEQGASSLQNSESAQIKPSSTRQSPRLRQRKTVSITKMLSQVASTTAASPKAHTTRTPSYTGGRPQKKARLCDEIEDTDLSPKQSKFFSTTSNSKVPPRSSPRTLKGPSSQSRAGADKALLQLPDVEGFLSPPRVRKSITIFEESSSSLSEGKSQTTSTISTQQSDPACIKETPPSSLESNSDPLLESVSETKNTYATSESSKTPYRASIQSYSYAPSTVSSCATTSRDSVFSARSVASLNTPATAASSRQTPLQRLGSKAFQSPSVGNVPPKPHEASRKSKDGPHSFKVPGAPVNPAFVPLPKVDVAEVQALSQACTTGGSEDQIFPESDAEADDDANALDEAEAEDGADAQRIGKVAAQQRFPKSLNLSRFAFR